MKLTDNAKKILRERYLARDKNGKIVETPEQMFKRVAKNIASADLVFKKTDIKKLEDKFYNLMINMEFLPNSPTLMNAGLELQQLSACFVLPVEDSMEGIFEAIKDTALIHQSGGGVGFSFSKLRPKGDTVKSTGGIASGPLSFMEVFNASTEVIKQGGKRRGANMAVLRVDHPDILEFITAKEKENALNNFNISVGITDKFMKALKSNKDFELINPRSRKVVRKVPAKNIFGLITESAWNNGEPGVLFLDRINKDNPTPALGSFEATNPCGEQPLLPYESCNLGSINLSKMVKGKKVDWDKLKQVTHDAVHFLDNVIVKSKFPLHKITEIVRRNRKIGLGVMGFADMLIQLGIPYNSKEALTLAGKVMKFIQDEGRKASKALAKERNIFANYNKSIYKKKNMKLRNATITTIAPTGTISTIANCSPSIEPLFAVSYAKKTKDFQFLETNALFQKYAEGILNEKLEAEIAKQGSIQNIKKIPPKLRKIFITAHDIEPEDHVKIQAAFQKYTDNAVSKTVNLPYGATKKDVEDVFKLAYRLGCKGITIYRDKSRKEQVIRFTERACRVCR
jgi:ribonucleoside-diphosphate reductase alpha chain